MRHRIKRFLCFLLVAMSVLLTLPLSVSAGCKTCSFGGTLWAEAIHPHQYFYYCMNGCGNKQYTGTFMTKSNCSQCNSSIRNCTHPGTWSNPNHPHETVCTSCCQVMGYNTPFRCKQCCVSSGDHFGSYGGWTEAAHQPGGYHDQYYTCTNCGDTVYKGMTYNYTGCTICNPPVQSSVAMYATGPENTITSSGILATTECPASYTVYARPTNCTVTSIYYLDNFGRQVPTYGSSLTYNANLTTDFGTKTYYCTTSTGVTGSISVNFTYERRAASGLKWRSVGATIRSVKLDNTIIKTGLSEFIEFEQYHNGLPESSYDKVANIIGRQDGKSYTLVCSTVAEVYSVSNGAAGNTGVTLAKFDTYNEYDDLVNYAAWTSQTLSAFESAKVLNISYQAPVAVNGTATWKTSDGTVLATKTAQNTGSPKWVYPSESATVTFKFSDWSGSSGYNFKSMSYSGASSGTSTNQQTYSQTYTSTSSAVSVTFICDKSSSNGSVTVNVYDGETRQLISNPKVTCGTSSKTANPAVFSGLSFKNYSVSATATGYDSASGTATISSSKPNETVDLFMYKGAGTITVKVLDASTNMPISGASVSGAGSGTTNSGGTVTFNNMSFIGTHSFTASKSGYSSGSGSATVSRANPSATVTIYLTSNTTPVTTTGSVTVYVRDATTNALLSSASVSGSGSSGYTNSWGYVTFSGLSLGTHVFTASKSGYNSNSGMATLSALSTSTTITIYLTPITSTSTGNITVYTRNANTGALISGASVSTGLFSGTTNSSGYVILSNMSLGNYSFTASKSGYYSNTGTASITSLSNSATITIYLTPITTTSTGNVIVYVRDASTYALLSSATVSGSGYSGTTNSSGYVIFASLPTGSYTFTASKSGYNSNSGSVTVTASTTQTLTIYLTKTPVVTTGNVTVYVRNANTGALLSGAKISTGAYSGTTGSGGSLLFMSLSLGTHTFTASKTGYTTNTGTATISAASPSTSITIYLTPLPTSGTVNVTVKNASTGAVISSASVSNGSTIKYTSSSGTASFTNQSFRNYTFTASKSGYFSNTGTATISQTSPTANITIYLTPEPTSGNITVYVRDKDTNAVISGANVKSGSYTGTTNSSGYIRFRNIPLTSYTFTVSKDGYKSNTGTATITTTSTTSSITIYLSKITSDVSISANDINGVIYKGSTVIVSATVSNSGDTDFIPDNPLSVVLSAKRNGSSVFKTQTQTVICPKNDSNLVWFTLDIPLNGYTSNTLSFNFTVTPPSGVSDNNAANNTSTRTVTAVTLPARKSPDASFELDPPASFSYSAYNTNSTPTLSWSVYEWNSGFVKRNYTAKLSLSASIIPDETAGYREQVGSLWTTRSGYGLTTSLTANVITSASGALAGNDKVNVYYPEHNYLTSASLTDMLEKVGSSFVFKSNSDSISGSRYHATPIWFPDGKYNLKYYVYDKWCPAGMLTGYTYASVNIEGSLYDDLHTN